MLENHLWRRWSDEKVWEWVELILQPFLHFTYITTHSSTLPLLHLGHSSFSNPYFASPTSQDFHLRHRIFTYVTGFSLTSQDFHLRHRIFTYVTGFSLTSPGEPPMPGFDSRLQPKICLWKCRVWNGIHPASWEQVRRPALWSRSNIAASHLADPDSIPDRTSYPGWDFFRGFSSTVRCQENLGRIHPRITFVVVIKNHFIRVPMTSDVDAP